MKHWLLVLTFLLLVLVAGHAQDTIAPDTAALEKQIMEGQPVELFSEANQLYKQKKYPKAIRYYQAVLERGYESSSLYFNLGNSYYKTDQLAPAILNYERAKQLAPGDEDIRYNLRMANTKIADEVQETPEIFLVKWWRENVQSISPNRWAQGGILSLWIAFALSLAFLYSSGGLRKIGFFGAIAMFALSLLLNLASFLKYQHMQEEEHGIVFARTAYVKSSPNAESTDVFIVHEGLKVELLQEEDQWQQIRLEDGKVGWLKEENLRAI